MQKHSISPQIIELLVFSLNTVQYGFLVLTVQDGCVIRMEKTEKFIFSSKNKLTSYIKRDTSQGKHPLQKKILDELQEVQYGQLIIRLEDGKVEQIEKTIRRRINEVEGINGDGI
jgi:hypothetical protein